MVSRIHVITPVTTEAFRNPADFVDFERPGISITHECLKTGPASIESEFDEALAVPATIDRIIEAERNGAAAVVIDCLGDPAVAAGREVTSIPIVGPGEASMHLAAQLGGKFAVVTVLESVCPMIENIAAVAGLANSISPIRVIDIPVLELEARKDEILGTLIEQARLAIVNDHARAIILGCTGMKGWADEIGRQLAAKLGLYIPVIDPVDAAIAHAIALVELGLSHSKLAYRTPTRKPIAGFDTCRFEAFRG